MMERCKNCRKLEERLYWTQFPARRLHFFRVLTGDFSRHLSIPRKFVKHIEGELSEVAVLKGPNGNVCNVGLKRTDDEVLFHNGWKEFVEQCSVEPGDLLVFRYEGKLCFNVQIFDGSGCEKEYLYFTGNTGKIITNEGYQAREKATTEEFAEILHVSSQHEGFNWASSRKLERDNPLGSRPSCPLQSVQTNENEMTSLTHRIESNCINKKNRSKEAMIDLENPTTKPNQHIHSSKIVEVSQRQKESIDTTFGETRWCSRWFMSNRRPVTDEEKERALQAARAFTSRNPSFTVVLRSSYVYKKCPLAIPTNFAKIYLPKENQIITLRSASGKAWPVKYTYRTYAGLGRGWVNFVWENNLEEGDVCVFELANERDMIVLEVVIFRVVEEVVPLTCLSSTIVSNKRGRPAKGVRSD